MSTAELTRLALELGQHAALAAAGLDPTGEAAEAVQRLGDLARRVIHSLDRGGRNDAYLLIGPLDASCKRLRRAPDYGARVRPLRDAGASLGRALELAEPVQDAITRCSGAVRAMRIRVIEAVRAGGDPEGAFARLAGAETQLGRAHDRRRALEHANPTHDGADP